VRICFGGKTLCGGNSLTRKEKGVRVFNAFLNAGQTVVAHISMDSDKDSEAHALDKILQTLDIKNTVITADAAHCQKKL
jgi:hypothetical protein